MKTSIYSLDPRGVGITICTALCLCSAALAQPSRFSRTNSRTQYVHRIELYDANGRKIDPEDPNAPPYSPAETCGKCHDYESIAHGFHFNAMGQSVDHGRHGEPWIWTDRRTGTQIPLSYRGWEGTYRPEDLNISPRAFVLKFGRHLPGGGPGDGPTESDAAPATDETADGEPADPAVPDPEAMRWKQSGPLAIDCMMCHANGNFHSPEAWLEQIEKENFAWAATAAMGLAKIDGAVKSLPADFDPETAGDDEASRSRMPTTVYNMQRFDANKQVFFDVIRTPPNNACYFCHTDRPVGNDVAPDWTHDEDVHVKAGMSCSACHRNGISHHTVRGFEGEEHPTGISVTTLSCRGCHMDDHEEDGSEHTVGGRMGAPKPLHAGLPPLHLEKMSCTSCHSGPAPASQVGQVQTSKAHELGVSKQTHEDAAPPGVVSPVFLREDETIYPYRMMWPAFWGMLKDGQVTPIDPEESYSKLRRILRVRRDFTQELSTIRLRNADKAEVLGEDRASTPTDELTDEEKEKLAQLEQTKAMEAFQEKLAKSLSALAEGDESGSTPVYISGGRAMRLDAEGNVESFDHDAAKPYAWKLAHDVRPARWSTGASGCYECHSDGAPLFEGVVTAIGPAPDAEPLQQPMYQLQGLDKTKLEAWNQMFRGRTAFKWIGFVSMGSVAIILLLYLLIGVSGLFGLLRRRSAS